MTTFSYIVRTADKSQLDHLSLMQQAIDCSLDFERKIIDADSIYTADELNALYDLSAALGEAFTDRFIALGGYWEDSTHILGQRIGDEWHCADCNVEGIVAVDDPDPLCNNCTSWNQWVVGRFDEDRTASSEYAYGHRRLNAATYGDLNVCTDLFEGYEPVEDIPF